MRFFQVKSIKLHFVYSVDADKYTRFSEEITGIIFVLQILPLATYLKNSADMPTNDFHRHLFFYFQCVATHSSWQFLSAVIFKSLILKDFVCIKM